MTNKKESPSLSGLSVGSASPSPPSLSLFPSSLYTGWLSLGAGARKLGLKLYRALFNHYWPFSRLDALHMSFALPDVLRSLSPALPLSGWRVLSLLWLLSGGAARAVDSRGLPRMSDPMNKQLVRLVKLGLLSRSTFDPAHPHRIAFRASQPVFISFTPAGARFYSGALRKLRQRSSAVLWDYMQYQHEKGQGE